MQTAVILLTFHNLVIREIGVSIEKGTFRNLSSESEGNLCGADVHETYTETNTGTINSI